MAGNVNHTDSAETAGYRGARKRRSLEKLPHSTGRTEKRGLGAVREIATGGLAATWNASQAGVERGAALLPAWLRRLGYYALALLFVAVAVALRWALSDVLSPTPFLVFYLAWVGAAAFGGLGPGLLATVASWICIEFLFDSTLGLIGFTDPMALSRMLIMLVGGLAVSLIGEKMRRARFHERRQGRTLAELAQSLAREKGLLQTVMTGAKNSHLVYLDRDFNFVRVNEAYARTCGYTPEEMTGKNHFALYPHAENEAIFTRVRDTGVPVEVHDKPFVFPDQPERGTTYWDWTLTPVKNGSGRVEGLIYSLFETTQRKQAEELLRESEERFHRLFEEDLTGDFLSTREGRITLCNSAFADIFGFASAKEAVGTSMLDLYVDPGERNSMLEALQRQGKLDRYEAWRKRRDGAIIHVVENLVGNFDDEGELYEVQGYIFEDTERKRAEEALRDLNATLESKVAQRTGELEHRARQLQRLTLELSEAENRERKRLAEILHDDLQQVLAAAKFHLGLLENGIGNPEESRQTAGQVRQMLTEAIEKSRSLSRELSPPGLAHSDLRETFEWLADQVQTKHGLTVHVDVRDQIRLQSEPLRVLLYKATQELLFNVVKHARSGEAWIRLRRLGGYICLSVSDKGRGFDPEQLQKVAGFGLLNIRERVSLLGGRMKIKSAKGKGSTFHIVVPCDELPGKAVS